MTIKAITEADNGNYECTGEVESNGQMFSFDIIVSVSGKCACARRRAMR